MPSTNTERMMMIADDLEEQGWYMRAASVRALVAERDMLAGKGSQWRHKKRGGLYALLDTQTKLECSTAPEFEDCFRDDVWPLYRSSDGHLYVRLVKEFADGRFEPAVPDAEIRHALLNSSVLAYDIEPPKAKGCEHGSGALGGSRTGFCEECPER